MHVEALWKSEGVASVKKTLLPTRGIERLSKMGRTKGVQPHAYQRCHIRALRKEELDRALVRAVHRREHRLSKSKEEDDNEMKDVSGVDYVHAANERTTEGGKPKVGSSWASCSPLLTSSSGYLRLAEGICPGPSEWGRR